MQQYRSEIRRIMIAVNVIDGAYEMIAKKIGIKENVLILFYALDDGEQHSQNAICKQWLIPKTTLNTVIKKYVAKGYLLLNENENKKVKTIALTKQGQAYARKILKEVYDVEEKAIAEILNSESADFIGTLERFTANLKLEARKYRDEQ